MHPGFSKEEGHSPPGDVCAQGKLRLPERAESCRLWLQTHVSEDFASTQSDVKPAGRSLSLSQACGAADLAATLCGEGEFSLAGSKEITQQVQ